jgi:hypothetical protein
MKCRTGAVGAPNDGVSHRLRNVQTARVQPYQLRATFLVGQWKLNRLIDAAGTRGQRGLELVSNIETAYFLQNIEQFEGPASLATNLKQNLDTPPRYQVVQCGSWRGGISNTTRLLVTYS